MNTIKILLLTCLGIIFSGLAAKSQAFKTSSAYTYDANGNRISASVIYLSSNLKSDTISLKQIVPDNMVSKTDTSGLPKQGWGLGSSEPLAGMEVIVYPNPSHGIIILEISGISNKQMTSTVNTILVWDTQGRQIISKNISVNYNTIDLSRQPNGEYLLKLIIGDQVKNFKIIKE